MPQLLTRRPATLPALLFASLLLISNAPAQDQKTEPARPPQSSGGVGTGTTDPPVRPDANTEPVFKHNQVTKTAIITYKPEPRFTYKALANGVSGIVRLRAVLHSSGKVTDITVIDGLPHGLTKKAIAAAKKIKFQPAQKDGRPVSQSITLEYNFFP